MPTSTDPTTRAAFYLRMKRTAIADATRPIDIRTAWLDLKSACGMLGVINQDDLAGHYYVAAVEQVWEARAAARPVGPVGAGKFREWADAFDDDLAGLLRRLASGDMEAKLL